MWKCLRSKPSWVLNLCFQGNGIDDCLGLGAQCHISKGFTMWYNLLAATIKDSWNAGPNPIKIFSAHRVNLHWKFLYGIKSRFFVAFEKASRKDDVSNSWSCSAVGSCGKWTAPPAIQATSKCLSQLVQIKLEQVTLKGFRYFFI